MISWRRFSSVTARDRPIAGRFGSIESMPKAPKAPSAAIKTTNSAKPMLKAGRRDATGGIMGRLSHIPRAPSTRVIGQARSFHAQCPAVMPLLGLDPGIDRGT